MSLPLPNIERIHTQRRDAQHPAIQQSALSIRDPDNAIASWFDFALDKTNHDSQIGHPRLRQHSRSSNLRAQDRAF